MKIKRHLIVYPNSGELWDAVNKVFINPEKNPVLSDKAFGQ
jgi:S-methylmethionine-dependent homocysteine/selenocysteine methylase